MVSPHDAQAAQEAFALVAKAMASPHRLTLLDVLAQSERSVEELVSEAGLPFANVSQHLQVLKRASLVTARREGQRVVYALAGDDVVLLFGALKATAGRHLAEAGRVLDSIAKGREELDEVSVEELARLIEAGEVTVLDVRSPRDFAAAHIPGSINVPHDEVEERLAEIPRDKPVVAYCRGPYCICSDRVVRALLHQGLRAARLDAGLPQWRAKGFSTSSL